MAANFRHHVEYLMNSTVSDTGFKDKPAFHCIGGCQPIVWYTTFHYLVHVSSGNSEFILLLHAILHTLFKNHKCFFWISCNYDETMTLHIQCEVINHTKYVFLLRLTYLCETT